MRELILTVKAATFAAQQMTGEGLAMF